MQSLLILIHSLLTLCLWVLVIAVIMSWLTAFNMINTQNRFIYLVMDFLYRATEPVLKRIRRWIPSMGGIDISPLLLILLIVFLQNLLREYGGRF
ncbi:MAG: YggT family protein [Rhodospirillales bacterium]|jgi:YggT family protein|nr:YggT family protein [Rhodospirillales bacterium]